MIVRAKEKCFIGGSLRRPGQLFEYGGAALPHFLELAEEDVPVSEPAAIDPHEQEEELGKLRVKLAQHGVKVAPRTGKAKMLEMLAEVEAPKVTAAK